MVGFSKEVDKKRDIFHDICLKNGGEKREFLSIHFEFTKFRRIYDFPDKECRVS